MHLHHNLGGVGPPPCDLAARTSVGRDHSVGRLLPGRERPEGLLAGLDEALGRGTLTRHDLERCIAAAEGRSR